MRWSKTTLHCMLLSVIVCIVFDSEFGQIWFATYEEQM